ncbi:GFM2 [Bugula neritina]|uniref:GFM2 n=1 Tax=Bugula neritina TaxID=10212 RepID=A0A7J7JC19_BUGNE|nr:GFM2 [Bugula neritina]
MKPGGLFPQVPSSCMVKRLFLTTCSRRCNKSVNAVKIDKSKTSVKKLSSQLSDQPISKIRNVGIIAHIDAGKTTTTERFLYYSGITGTIGSVDEGTTVTDYLTQERERGITIQSAAVSLNWQQHRINIVDTPGHIDFTIEVERTLRVMDSAIGILDVSAGVEAQTKTVWRQANRFNLPRLLFLNKMDKRNADIDGSLTSIRNDLGTTPLLIQHNLGTGSSFTGIVDLPSMTCQKWDRAAASQEFTTTPLTNSVDSALFDKCLTLRNNLIDNLAELDPIMMDVVINSVSYDDITSDCINKCLRRVTCDNKAVPVLIGSSLKSRCIQPLLDAVVDYLPNPENSNSKFAFDDKLCAFAFKTVHQKERGAVTFLRLYNGAISTSMTVYNSADETTDRIGKIYMILADQMLEIKQASAGSIVAVTGLAKTVTGDTLVTNAKAAEKYSAADVQLPTLSVPEPVFMCSIETYSSKEQRALEEALKILVREDPSLRIKLDPETQQMVLMGMGELHLDIVKDRLLKEHKLEVYLGKMLVAYRETIERPSNIIHHTLNKTIGDTTHHVSVAVSVEPCESQSKTAHFVCSGEQSWDKLKWYHRKPIDQGTSQALLMGPLLGYPVVGCHVNVHNFTLHSSRTSAAMISAAIREAVHQALQDSVVILSEPEMRLQIYCDEDNLSDILYDLTHRRAVIGNVEHTEDGVIVHGVSPVATLLGYSTTLRKLSSGRAHFMMEIAGYISMSEQQTKNIVSELSSW